MHLLSVQQDLYTQRRARRTGFLPYFLLLALVAASSSLYANQNEALSPQNDGDGDGIANTIDIDDDNDGIPDLDEIAIDGSDTDSDGDGMPNRLDLDSDNDGIPDWIESGASRALDLSTLRKVGGRLVGEVSHNGLLDAFETSPDSGVLAYSLANTDENDDSVPDFLDLDSDNDGWPDLREAGVSSEYDLNNDARLDALGSSVGNDGIYDYLQSVNDLACCDLNGDGVDDILPLNSDGTDLPDFQDLDSDNDGVSDIEEFGGLDADGNGRVDNFRDVEGGPDGIDDGALAFPYVIPDADGNGVSDHLDGADQTTDGTGGDDPSTDPMPGTPDEIADGMADDDVTGKIQTGLNASGCSIVSGAPGSQWFWLLLLLVAIVRLSMSKSRSNVAREG